MNIARTPLYNRHLELQAHMAVFANTWLPSRFSSEKEEHQAVRNFIGLFDVSHMGEFLVKGPDAKAFLQKMLTRNIKAQKPGQALYTLMLNEKAGIIDDLIIYCLGDDHFMLCVNAANIERDWQWLNQHRVAFNNLSLSDVSKDYGQLALQGPKALSLLKKLSDEAVPEPFYCRYMTIGTVLCLVARTGYTGEDGVEIFVDINQTEKLWDVLFKEGQCFGIKACGLAARDSLRLEAGLLLHGTDMDEITTPFEAGIMFAVDASNTDFIGKSALVNQEKNGAPKKLVGFRLLEKGVARHGFRVLDEHSCPIGVVSSGSWPPAQELAIGFAYVDSPYAKLGTPIFIDIRQRLSKARIVKRRFLQRLA